MGVDWEGNHVHEWDYIGIEIIDEAMVEVWCCRSCPETEMRGVTPAKNT